MPRQDVPYGGAICRLKERIAEIWDELGKKLHSINGVEGDAAGDVKIVSGDATVVVTSDQVNHEIEIALDTSQLPAAAVSSVNGQTGAVVLDASDINVIGGSDVATDLGNLDADLQQAQTDIATEALTRANADSTLQTNINTLSASLPSAAAAAVAADPTVAQLVTDMGGKVDLSDVSTVETPDTIAKRNGSGRLVAADPASGATDKSLVTANWVSQTGDSSPNNLLHRSGNETAIGIKTFSDYQKSEGNVKEFQTTFAGGGVTGTWIKLAETTTQDEFSHFILYGTRNNSNAGFMDFWVYTRRGGNSPIALLVSKVFTPNWNPPEACITLDSAGKVTVWGKQGSNVEFRLALLMSTMFTNVTTGSWVIPSDTTGYSNKPTTSDYDYVVDVI